MICSSRVHASFAYVLYAMVVAHVAGAVKHQWLDKQPELQRMLPGSFARMSDPHAQQLPGC